MNLKQVTIIILDTLFYKRVYFLYEFRNMQPHRTFFHTIHFSTDITITGGFFYVKTKLFERPDILAEMIIIILSEHCVYFGSVLTYASLAPAARNRLKKFLKPVYHLVK